ncbi:MAG: hypothetical protein OHK0021_14040 [Bryobacter sp.]
MILSLASGLYGQTKGPDPLGRGNPKSSFLGFLRAAHEGDLRRASLFLQFSNTPNDKERQEAARQLSFILDRGFTGNLDALSAKPEGSANDGLAQSRELAGHIITGDTWTSVELVRVTDAGRQVWLLSSDIVDAVPKLFPAFGFPWVESILPKALLDIHVLQIPLWVFLAILLALPVALGIGYLLGRLLMRLIPRQWSDAVKPPLPVVLLIGLALHSFLSQTLGLPLLYRQMYLRVITMLFIAVAVWLIFGLIEYGDRRARIYLLDRKLTSTQAMVQLGRRLLQVFVVLIAVLVGLRSLGYDITAALAGLGIGGIAIALGAQKTLENLIGGFSLLSDQSIRVGDACLFNGNVATVEEIGLRATKFRTLIRTALYIPNGQLASMNIENLGYRDKILCRHTIGVTYGTKTEDLTKIRDEVTQLLVDHPMVDPEVRRIRFIGFGDSSLNFELFAYILTSDWNEFLNIQEDLLLKVMNIVESNKSGFAFPSRTVYVENLTQAKNAS